MTFDETVNYQAASAAVKEPIDWKAWLSLWIGAIAIVALGLFAQQMEKVRHTIEAHDKVIELQMRNNDTSMLITERALALFEERQAAVRAREMQLRTSQE